jgi:hypothetical protein
MLPNRLDNRFHVIELGRSPGPINTSLDAGIIFIFLSMTL